MVPVSVAIDGPAGAGKSTVAKSVAKRLGFLYVDSGAMYRAIAYLCIQHGVDFHKTMHVLDLMEQHSVSFDEGPDRVMQVWIDNQNVTDDLRTPEVSQAVSTIATMSAIRERLTQFQRDLAKGHSVVMDGRDIGTVVLPEAAVKVFLTADVYERANRRKLELENKGFQVSLDEMVRSVADRDRQDSNREVAPLCQADDAVCIDSTGKSVDDVVTEILSLVTRAYAENHE